MIKLKSERRIPALPVLVAVLALLAAGFSPLMLADEVQAQGGEDEVKAWKNIALLYTTDIKGKIEPCG